MIFAASGTESLVRVHGIMKKENVVEILREYAENCL